MPRRLFVSEPLRYAVGAQVSELCLRCNIPRFVLLPIQLLGVAGLREAGGIVAAQGPTMPPAPRVQSRW
jgi:hypothetical protein